VARSIKLTVAYNGTAYAGWQVQPGQPTIQAAIETALLKITGEAIRVTASGRTDAGVHALGQVVSFETDSVLSAAVIRRAVDAETPFDITILNAEDAPPRFHAIRDAIRKRYRYVIQDDRLCDVFARGLAWHIPYKLDVTAMAGAAAGLTGTHDFIGYAASGFQARTTVRTISELSVRRAQGPLLPCIHIEIEADGFLYNMVRNITGTLVDVGRGAKAQSWPAEVLRLKDRNQAGMTAPPDGLFLVNVDYNTTQ